MMIILANAFSINMLSGNALVQFEKISEEQVKQFLGNGDFVSAIGHASTASLLSSRLGVQVAENRIPVSLEPGAHLFVAQVKGRLPEGKVLSEEEIAAVQIDFWLVTQEQ